MRFYLMAKGSGAEFQNYLILCRDLGCISEEEFNQLKVKAFEGYKIVCGLIKSTAIHNLS